MKIAIRGHDVCEKNNIDVFSNALSNVDISGLQLVAYKSFVGFDYILNSITEEKAIKLGKDLKDNNISIELIGAYFNPVHSNKEKVYNGIAIFKEYLKYAKILGSNIVASETGSYNDDKWTYNPKNRTEEARKIVVNTFKDLCDYAKEYGSLVAIEGAAGHVLYDVQTLKTAFDEISKDNLKIVFDLYNFLDETNSTNYLEILDLGLETFKDKIHCFHIKDCFIEDSKAPVQCAVGKGDFNYREILKKIRAYNENAILVLEGTTGEDIKSAVKLLKDLWEENEVRK